jgi:hypothetical protein
MILLMFAMVLFAWSDNLAWRIHEPEYRSEIQSLSKQRKRIVRVAWAMVALIALSFFLRLSNLH